MVILWQGLCNHAYLVALYVALMIKQTRGLVVSVQRIIMGRNPIHGVLFLLCPSHRSRHISRVLGVVQLMYVGCCSKGLLV